MNSGLAQPADRNLAEVDATLTERVAAALGVAPPTPEHGGPDESAYVSPALSQLPPGPGRIDGRRVAILAADDVDGDGIAKLGAALGIAGATAIVVAPTLGLLTSAQSTPIPAAKASLTAQSVEFDAVVIAGGASAATLSGLPVAAMLVNKAFRHHKPIAGTEVDADFAGRLIEAMGWHRFWDRQLGPSWTQRETKRRTS